MNLQFIETCDRLRILLLILPPHSTHRLQPLDVSLFAPLARFYTNNLNTQMANSLGMASMSKRSFWGVFWPAWQKAFVPANIISAFSKTGIWPFNLTIVLSEITMQLIEAPVSPQRLKTPMTSHAVRRLQQQYHKAPSSPLLNKLFRANERLVSQHSINQHTLHGMIEAFKLEKKKRRRGKRLNLTRDEDSGPQFFSPARVEAARTWQASKDAEEVQRQQSIQESKAAIAMKKLEKQKIATEKRIQKAAEKQLQKSFQDSLIRYKRIDKSSLKPTTKLTKSQNRRTKQLKKRGKSVVVDREEDVVLATSSGRRVRRPMRFAH